MTGRGGWSKIGMPSNGTGYYELLSPTFIGSQPNAGPDFLATHLAVIAIQRRINALGFKPALAPDGVFGVRTNIGLRWAQGVLGVTVDGQFGPRTSAKIFWPFIIELAHVDGSTGWQYTWNGILPRVVGGITMHESGFDPGAIGFSTPDDHGLVQINAPANPKVTIPQAFDPRFSFTYCAQRINAALQTYNNLDIAICSYASPLWAQEWHDTGVSPNQAMTDYVTYVKNWKAPV